MGKIVRLGLCGALLLIACSSGPPQEAPAVENAQAADAASAVAVAPLDGASAASGASALERSVVEGVPLDSNDSKEAPGDGASASGDGAAPGDGASAPGDVAAPGDGASASGDGAAPGDGAPAPGDVAAPGDGASAPGDVAAPGDDAEAPGDDAEASDSSSETGDAPARFLDTPMERAQAREAAALNTEGLRLHRDGAFAAAIAKYKAALAADDGYVLARYNLGCALARTGKKQDALATLQRIADDGSPEGVARILAARDDEDFASLRGDARFTSLVAQAEQGLPTLDEAGEEVRVFLDAPGEHAAPRTFPERFPVRTQIRCSACEGWEDGGDITARPNGSASLLRWYRSLHRQASRHNGVVVGEKLTCRGGCCSAPKVEDDEATEETLYLERVCFQMDGERPLFVTHLRFLDGG